jgi:hypothetical protein
MLAFDVKLTDIRTVKTTCRSSCPLDLGSFIAEYSILQLQGVLFHSIKEGANKTRPYALFPVLINPSIVK